MSFCSLGNSPIETKFVVVRNVAKYMYGIAADAVKRWFTDMYDASTLYHNS